MLLTLKHTEIICISFCSMKTWILTNFTCDFSSLISKTWHYCSQQSTHLIFSSSVRVALACSTWGWSWIIWSWRCSWSTSFFSTPFSFSGILLTFSSSWSWEQCLARLFLCIELVLWHCQSICPLSAVLLIYYLKDPFIVLEKKNFLYNENIHTFNKSWRWSQMPPYTEGEGEREGEVRISGNKLPPGYNKLFLKNLEISDVLSHPY